MKKIKTELRVRDSVARLTADKPGSLFAKFASVGAVAKDCNISDTTARRWLEFNVAMGRLRRERFGNTRGYRLRIYS